MLNKEKAIENLLTRNVEEVIEKKHLEQALLSGKKLRVKHGVDPTGEKIHIGRAVALRKLKEFQDLGHKIILIIGDFTAQIGDPSDKLSKRPFLTKEQIQKNLKNYLPQIGKIIDIKKTEVHYKKIEIHYNSEWLSKLDFRETAELAESFSVNQMLHRRAFRERFQKGEDISLREFMYPIMQGYDSVMVKADVEIGGEDQLFNLMSGRVVQKHYGQKEQDILTVRMLLGVDGRKMSTSWGNVINIADSQDEQFGKVMSLNDSQIINYFRLATGLSEKEIIAVEKELKNGANPRDIKLSLANEIVSLYHGKAAGNEAEENWKNIFSRKKPEIAEITPLRIGILLQWYADDLVLKTRAIKSRSAAWRLIEQGGFQINGEKITDPRKSVNLIEEDILKIGKKNFFRVKLK